MFWVIAILVVAFVAWMVWFDRRHKVSERDPRADPHAKPNQGFLDSGGS